MSSFFNTSNEVSEHSKTTSNLRQSYTEYKTDRTVRFKEVSDDIQTTRFLNLEKKQNELQDLISQVNEARANLANLDKDYILEKEALSTDLSRIKVETEISSSESRRRHIGEIESLRDQHRFNMDRVEYVFDTVPQNNLEAGEEAASARADVRKFEQSVMEMKSNVVIDSDEEMDMSIYHDRISSLEMKKQSLTQAIREETSQHKSQLIELTVSLDELEENYRIEIEQEKSKLAKLDSQYKMKLSSLFGELERLRVQRDTINDKRVTKLSNIENQSSNVESEVRAKIRDATRVAEKLKTALVNANMRKSQQLAAERQRSSGYQSLLQENCLLKEKLFKLERDLSKARTQSNSLKNELSSSVGPRRAASLFL